MPATVPEIIPAPAPAAAPIQELRPVRVPRTVEDVAPSRAPCRAPRRVARMLLPATSAQVPVRPEAVRADCSHSFSRESSTNCASPVARAGALAQPAPSSIAARAAASHLCRHTASMRVTSEVGGGFFHNTASTEIYTLSLHDLALAEGVVVTAHFKVNAPHLLR